MSTTTTQLRTPHTNARTQAHPSPGGTRERKQTLHVGTFADGQRVSPITVTYSAPIGSFGRAAAG